MFAHLHARSVVRPLMCGVLALTLTGCVSAGTHEALQREADQVKQELERTQALHVEQQKRVQALETRNRELKEQTDKWEANLKATVTRLERLAEGWGQVRDDLIRLNLDRELKDLKAKNPSARAVITLEPEREAAAPEPAGASAAESAPSSKHAAIQRVLEEFRTLLGD